jgi:hypothetical protein
MGFPSHGGAGWALAGVAIPILDVERDRGATIETRIRVDLLTDLSTELTSGDGAGRTRSPVGPPRSVPGGSRLWWGDRCERLVWRAARLRFRNGGSGAMSKGVPVGAVQPVTGSSY